ncbi:MAG: hypothetical protein ABFD13_06255 [Candidatus Cryosericum sp.]|nr:hypothetical protein [bacterium]
MTQKLQERQEAAGSICLVTALVLLFLVAGRSHGTNEPMPGPDPIPDKTVISEEAITFPSGEKYVLQLKQTGPWGLWVPSSLQLVMGTRMGMLILHHQSSVVFYLCEPLSDKTAKFSR